MHIRSFCLKKEKEHDRVGRVTILGSPFNAPDGVNDRPEAGISLMYLCVEVCGHYEVIPNHVIPKS